MGEVWFYHLEQRSVEQELPGLLQRGLERGLKMAVRAPMNDRARAISNALWAYDDVSFLAHSFNEETGAAQNTIVIFDQGKAANAADYEFCIDGTAPDDFAALTRATIMFDGHDPSHVDAARALWKRCKSEGHTIRYWKQDENGRWADQAA
jgi:DNA polymerase III subunit chi